MTESVSFKAYLKRNGQEVEVRRFGIDSGAATNFVYLQSKIQAMFSSIQNNPFKIFWQDSEKDYITISCDEELVEALASSNVQPFKLFVNITDEEQGATRPKLHAGITCDGCDGNVSGFRYKCVTCPNYDLCASCEAAGRHPEHFMLRIPWPVGSGMYPKVFRKFLGRPHKFHKFARQCGQPSGFNMDEGGRGPGRCPFSTGGIPSTSNMFDFSSLLNFLTSLEESFTGETNGINETTANAQRASNSQAPQQPNLNSEQQTRPHPFVPQNPDLLQNIEKTLAAFLNPLFGIPGNPQASAQAQPNTPAPFTTQQPATPTPTSPPSTTPQAERTPTPLSTPSREATPVPVATEKQPESVVQSARRNSDDWTLVNRESPTRNEAEVVAMDMEVASGSQSVETPSAPSIPLSNALDQKTRERIEEIIAKLRSMGFQHETKYLEQIIVENNYDMIAVLEKIFKNYQPLTRA